MANSVKSRSFPLHDIQFHAMDEDGVRWIILARNGYCDVYNESPEQSGYLQSVGPRHGGRGESRYTAVAKDPRQGEFDWTSEAARYQEEAKKEKVKGACGCRPPPSERSSRAGFDQPAEKPIVKVKVDSFILTAQGRRIERVSEVWVEYATRRCKPESVVLRHPTNCFRIDVRAIHHACIACVCRRKKR